MTQKLFKYAKVSYNLELPKFYKDPMKFSEKFNDIFQIKKTFLQVFEFCEEFFPLILRQSIYIHFLMIKNR